MGCRGCRERAIRAASQSLTDHWHCQCHHPCDCSAVEELLGWVWGLESELEDVLACVEALILGTGAGKGRGDSSPFPNDSGVIHWCIVISVDFRVFPLSCAQMSVCGAEVSNLLLPLGCKDRDECKKKLLRI